MDLTELQKKIIRDALWSHLADGFYLQKAIDAGNYTFQDVDDMYRTLKEVVK